MLSLEKEFNVGRSDWLKFVFIGDTHIGNITTDENLIARCVDRIKQDPDAYWFDLGDRCDYINTKDKRFDLGSLPKWVLNSFPDIVGACNYRYADFFSPIANKCLATVRGNHEDTILQMQERDVYTDINRLLGIKNNLGLCGYTRLKFRRAGKVVWSLDVFLHHGAVSGKSAGSSLNFLSSISDGFDADVYAIGHTHKKIAYSNRQYYLDSVGHVQEQERIYINTGSFMAGYAETENSGYAEKRLLYPQSMGPVELWVCPDKRDLKIFM